MPEGPASGRVEAKRRALTALSTAPASRTRWCDTRICVRKRCAFSGKPAYTRERFPFDSSAVLCRQNPEMKMCTRAARSSGTDCAQRQRHAATTNDGVNDPVPTAWVTREARQRGRSRHRWCCDVGTGALGRRGTERRLALLCAAKCAAPSGCPWFALMEQPGVRDCPKRASELGGQPDAIFAWPPVWPTRHGPSCW